ncbi:unnamed protein product, partial [Didymodactylos carnosus]
MDNDNSSEIDSEFDLGDDNEDGDNDENKVDDGDESDERSYDSNDEDDNQTDESSLTTTRLPILHKAIARLCDSRE